jgi:hypothetical protein
MVREDTVITVIYGIGYNVKSHECQYTNNYLLESSNFFKVYTKLKSFSQRLHNVHSDLSKNNNSYHIADSIP